MRFPEGTAIFRDHVARQLILATDHWSLRVHPVQLYEAVLALVLAVAILALVSRDKLVTGNAFMAFALGYGALRIVADLRRLPGLNALYGLCTTVIVLSAFFVARSWQKPATVRRGVRLARPQ